MPVKIRKFKSVLFFCLSLLFVCSTACKEQNSAAVSNATPTPMPSQPTANLDAPIILAFGDSLTEGYGLNKSQSYPSVLQEKLSEQGYQYRVVNAGISGDTTSGGASRIAAAILDPKTEIMILELGANDMLRGQDLKRTRENLDKIITIAQSKNIKIILAGMEAPPNLGEDYQREFRNIYADLTKKYQLKLIPFFLAGVAGNPALNQNDGLHPNVEGTAIVVENVWRVLEPMLKKE